MSTNPLAAKIAAPYARALYDFSVEQNIMHQITADFQNLESFLQTAEDLTNYLNNPLVSTDKKREILERTLKTGLMNRS
jgi:F-type H+-transporting ATPase subunit delta